MENTTPNYMVINNKIMLLEWNILYGTVVFGRSIHCILMILISWL